MPARIAWRPDAMSRSSVSRHRRRSARTGQLRAAGIERVQDEHRRRRAASARTRIPRCATGPAARCTSTCRSRRQSRREARSRSAPAGSRALPGRSRRRRGCRSVVRLRCSSTRSICDVRQHVLEPRGDVERVVRLANRIGEVPRRQRRDDRLGVERIDAVGRERQRGVLFPERPAEA